MNKFHLIWLPLGYWMLFRGWLWEEEEWAEGHSSGTEERKAAQIILDVLAKFIFPFVDHFIKPESLSCLGPPPLLPPWWPHIFQHRQQPWPFLHCYRGHVYFHFKTNHCLFLDQSPRLSSSVQPYATWGLLLWLKQPLDVTLNMPIKSLLCKNSRQYAIQILSFQTISHFVLVLFFP